MLFASGDSMKGTPEMKQPMLPSAFQTRVGGWLGSALTNPEKIPSSQFRYVPEE